eukprot:gene7601-9053_t
MESRSERVDSLDVASWLAKHGRTKNQIHVSQPREVSCWTRASSREGGDLKLGDRSGLHKLIPIPTFPADLNEGYPDMFVRKPEGVHPGVEPVAEALAQGGVPWRECDVVTFRNNLNKIAGTPFDSRKEWEVDACLSDGVLFLDIRDGPGDGRSFQNQDRFMYYGYKLEELSTNDNAKPSTVDATSEFCTVVRLRIGDLKIMMAAEIDCYHAGQETVGLGSYVEIKAQKIPNNPRQEQNACKFKYPRWWLQSWLA